MEFSVFQFLSIASYPFLWHYWEESGSEYLTSPIRCLYMLINSPLKPSLLQGKQTRVPQFLHACQMLQSLDIFVSLCWACFSVFMSFFYRASAVLNREEPSSPSTCWLCCSWQPGMLLAFFAGLMFNLLSTRTPKDFSVEILWSCLPPLPLLAACTGVQVYSLPRAEIGIYLLRLS